MYECFNRGDLETLKREVFSDAVVWIVPGRNPVGGVKRGADEVMEYVRELIQLGIRIDLVRLDSFGEDAVLDVQRSYGEVQDTALDSLCSTHYQITNGRISTVRVYVGDQYSVDNFYWAVEPLSPIPERWQADTQPGSADSWAEVAVDVAVWVKRADPHAAGDLPLTSAVKDVARSFGLIITEDRLR